MKFLLRASLLALSLLAFLPAAHAFNYSKISLSGSVYLGPQTAPALAKPAPPKTKLPLTNQRAIILCGLDPANASDYQVVVGIDDSQNFGIFVVLKTTGATVGTLLTYTTFVSGDGTHGFLTPGKKGYAILPVLSILSSTKVSGVLSGKEGGAIPVLKITATVDDDGDPHFALVGQASVLSLFKPTQPTPAITRPSPR